jgi:hypothetical protein
MYLFNVVYIPCGLFLEVILAIKQAKNAMTSAGGSTIMYQWGERGRIFNVRLWQRETNKNKIGCNPRDRGIKL